MVNPRPVVVLQVINDIIEIAMNHLKVKPKRERLTQRIGDYIVEEQALCKRLKLKRTLCINFPRKGKSVLVKTGAESLEVARWDS